MVSEQTAEINRVDAEQLEKFASMLGNRSRTFLQHLSDKDGVHPTSRYATSETLLPTVETLAAKGSKGTYWTINPIADGVTKVPVNADIVSRVFIFIDVDSPDAHREERRATDAELEQTENTAKAVDGLLQKCGIDSASILIDSGNGSHLFYSCNLPNNSESQATIKRLLDLLAELFGDAIDTSVHDPRRLGRVPGTLHGVSGRWCRIVTMPEANETVVTMDTLKAVVEALEMRTAAVRVESGDDAEPMEQSASANVLPFKMTATSGTSEDARVRAYVREAIAREMKLLANAPKRNTQLWETVKSLFGLVSGGMATESEVEAAIEDACKRNGLIDTEFNKSGDCYRRARAKGLSKPRKMPPPREQPSEGKNAPNPKANASVGVVESDERQSKGSTGKHSAADVVHLTDLGNAKRMAAEHGKIIRYCWAWEKWLVWDGRRWKIDNTGYVMLLAKRTIMGLYAWAEAQLKLLANDDSPEAKLKAIKVKLVLDFTIKSQHVMRLKAMIDLARSEPNIPIMHESLDRDKKALNCLNGKVDLRTGKRHDHNPLDYITALCPTKYDPNAKCPIFERTIDGIFKKDVEVIRYFLRFVAYCLSGETCEHIVPFAIGGGSNGKSLLFNLIIAMMGSDYAGTVVPELLMETAGNQHPTIKADLFGKRFMVAMESADGARLNEARVKALSGGDRIKARRCREDFWEFDATHKMLLCTNHRPTIVGDDHGIWRRIALIPFKATFWDADKGETGDTELKADKTLETRLQAEHAGILAWLVRECLKWQSEGLIAPAAVLEATSEYRTNEDRVQAFLDEVCTLHDGKMKDDFKTKVSDLTAAYKRWCDKSGAKSMSANSLTRAFADRGIEKDASRRWYLGITIPIFDGAKPSNTPNTDKSDAENEV